jgi:hypothetical protein
MPAGTGLFIDTLKRSDGYETQTLAVGGGPSSCSAGGIMDIDAALDELLLTRPVAENDIVQAHRRMAMRFHPDKASDPDEKRWVQQKFVRIQEAYELLKRLPLETINASPDRKLSQETSGGLSQQPKACPAPQPRHKEPHPSHSSASVVKVLYWCFAVIGVFLLILACAESGPHRLSGSPVLPTKEKALDDEAITAIIVDGLRIADAAAAKEFQQTFGRLLRIGDDPNGAYFACFERINQPVYNHQVIRGFWVHILPGYVIFFKENRSGTGTCRLSQ